MLPNLLRRLTGRRDYLDGIRDGVLHGWALPKRGAGPVPVALYAGPTRLAETLAGQFRTDLRDAGLAGGACGFSFAIETDAGVLRVCRMDGSRPVEIGRVAVDESRAEARPTQRSRRPGFSPGPPIHDALGPGFAALRAAPVPARDGMAKLTPRQAQLFDDTALPDPLCAYADHLRPRYRLEAQFDWETAPEDAAHFLNWVLASYAPMRTGLRVPLSRRMIQWLNAPVVVPGQRSGLSRATWAFLMGVPHLRQGMDFANPDWMDSVLYWWAIHQVRAIGSEDCLVPDAYVTRLAGLPLDQEGQTFPLSRYLLRWRMETPALARHSPDTEAGRRQITLAALVRAAERPDTLRYLPWASIETLLEEDIHGLAALRATPLSAQQR